jgi:methionine-rich copper-binding protein CopC
MQFDTKYVIQVSKGAKSQDGVSLQKSYLFSFTTEKATSPPTVSSTDPSNGTTNVPLDSNISITFSKPMNKGLTVGAVSLNPPFNWISSWDSGDLILTIDPYSDLTQNTKYTITITTAAKGADGTGLVNPYTFSFTTVTSVDKTPPTVAGTEPSNNQKGVDTAQKISITFSELMDKKSVESAVSISPGSITKMEWSQDGKTIDLTASLATGTKYVVTISTSAKDSAGNKLASAYSFSFETRSGAGLFGDQTSMLLILLIVIVIVLLLAFALMRRKKGEAVEKPRPDETVEENKEEEEKPEGKVEEPAKEEGSKSEGGQGTETKKEDEKAGAEGKEEGTEKSA